MGRKRKFASGAIVDKAANLFWRKGYAATTPANLVDELAIGKGSLYRSFDSKHNLFVLALQRYSVQRVELLAELLDGPGAVRPRLRMAFETFAGIGEHHRGCLMVNSTAERAQQDETVAQLAGDLFAAIEDMFGAAILHGQSTGEFDSTRDPAEAASGMLAALIGATVLAKLTHNPQRLSRIVDSAIDTI